MGMATWPCEWTPFVFCDSFGSSNQGWEGGWPLGRASGRHSSSVTGSGAASRAGRGDGHLALPVNAIWVSRQSRDRPSPTRDRFPASLFPAMFSLYKARKVPTKQPVCAICVDRTRGKTQRVTFGYGVEVWMCRQHASTEFLTGRSGRDLVVTLMGIWRANGCLTAARHKALDAHLNALKPRPQRERPGSYAWPKLRLRAEQLWRAGAGRDHVQHRILTAGFQNANPPSGRTIRRWHAERRWASRARSRPP
ncbi:MAG: hypothetical protein QOJ13_902 [Gaiellales bacterium]|nr:hypothetical protein [Gaiellales bacterium]